MPSPPAVCELPTCARSPARSYQSAWLAAARLAASAAWSCASKISRSRQMPWRLGTRTLNWLQSSTRTKGGSRLEKTTGTQPANTISVSRGVHGAKPPMIGQNLARPSAAQYSCGDVSDETTISGLRVRLPHTSLIRRRPSRMPGKGSWFFTLRCLGRKNVPLPA
jgi:hypothetical protein